MAAIPNIQFNCNRPVALKNREYSSSSNGKRSHEAGPFLLTLFAQLNATNPSRILGTIRGPVSTVLAVFVTALLHLLCQPLVQQLVASGDNVLVTLVFMPPCRGSFHPVLFFDVLPRLSNDLISLWSADSQIFLDKSVSSFGLFVGSFVVLFVVVVAVLFSSFG